MVAEQTKQILSECGIPQRVITDNGPQFTGETYQKCVCTWGIEHVTNSSEYQMSNGMLERAIRTSHQNCVVITPVSILFRHMEVVDIGEIADI